jgi:hypothetical protein
MFELLVAAAGDARSCADIVGRAVAMPSVVASYRTI